MFLTQSYGETQAKKSEFFRDVIDFIFGFENKRGDILDHWITFIDTYSLPPQEFYERIEAELAARKVPGMEMSREVFNEGGPISDRRIYLRMFRERLALYTCAAPFGTGYFFSCRTVYVPALVRLWHIVAALLFFGEVQNLLQKPLGPTFAIVAVVALAFALAGVLRNAAASALTNLDALLLKIPAVSTIYEHWFRNETYYRVDTRLVYLQRIPQLVREIADEMTAATGAKLLDSYERAPIFGKLYRRQKRESPEEKA